MRDNWEHGDAYEQFIGRWSSLVAVRFLDWLQLPGGLRWVDVGCGTGALSEAILDSQDPTSVVGVEPSAGFVKAAGQRLGDRAKVRVGPAESLPLPDGSADVVVSGLVLNFIADLPAALAEMRRVAPGGIVTAYVWDYSGGMDMLRLFWEAADEVDPKEPWTRVGDFPCVAPTRSWLRSLMQDWMIPRWFRWTSRRLSQISMPCGRPLREARAPARATSYRSTNSCKST